MKISLFKTGRDKAPSSTITITELLRRIRDGEWKPWIEKIRATKNEEVQKKIKSGLPAVTLCGTCKGRQIEKSSGYIGIDIDAQDNDPDLLDRIPQLCKDPYIHAVWRSSRGNGLWLLFKINHKKHAETFLGIEEYLFRHHRVVADGACKDNTRLCYVSWDPEAYYKQGKKVFKQLGKVTAIPGPTVDASGVIDYAEVKAMTQQIVDAQKDITHNYNDWLRMGLIYAELGDRGKELFHRASQFYRGYTKEDTDLQFKKCLRKVTNDKKIIGAKRANIQTLSFLMTKAGIKIKIPAKKKVDAPIVESEVKENAVIYATQMRDEGKGKYTFGLLEFKLTGKDDFKCTGASTARVAEWLYKQGFRAYKEKVYYHIENKIVEEVGATRMYNKVFQEIKKLPKGISFRFDDSIEAITKDMAMEAAQKNIKVIVDAIPMDDSFDPDDKSKFLHDNGKEIFLKFEDCLVSITAKGHSVKSYRDSPGLVWKRTIKPHPFKIEKGKCDIDKILTLAVGEKNRNTYMTVIGYMLSTHFPPEGVPMLFCCDLNIEDGVNNGGNGKDFMKQIIGQFREVVTIPAKSLDLKREFALHTGNKDTEVFWFEDLNKATKMDSFYNFSSGVPIRRLHTQGFTVQAKIGVSLQHTIDMEGSSNTRRQIFLLFENYFGKLSHGIASEFGQVFGEDWPLKKRYQFNAFMIECCQRYLKQGIEKMSVEKLVEARKDELGGELYTQLKLDHPYTSVQAMDAVQRGGGNISEMSQKHFVMNWRKWCEHMGYELTMLKTNGYRHYSMTKKVTLIGRKKVPR